MSAARRGDAARTRPRRPVDRAQQARVAPRHYVVFRTTRHPDGTIARHYDVAGKTGLLDEPGFNTWLTDNVPSGPQADLVSVLVIEETLDRHGSITTCSLERRLGSATGPLHGDPARVTFVGAVKQVRVFNATARGTLREVVPPLDRRTLPPSRVGRLTGEEQVVRAMFGAATRILDARESSLLEDIVGLTSVMHLCLPDGVEIDCGLGWHGTTSFILRADFPRFGGPASLPAGDAAAIAMAAITSGLTTFELRADAHGPAVIARSRANGSLHLIRPAVGGAQVEPYVPQVPPDLLNADQAIWARYAEAHENLALLDAYRDGRSDNVFVLAGAPDGGVTRHLIDADGVEVWRAAADDTAAAELHRERVLGSSCD